MSLNNFYPDNNNFYSDNSNQLALYQADANTSSDQKTKSPALALAAVSAFSSLLGAADTISGGPEERARKNMRYQSELNDTASRKNYQRSIEMWKMQNEYDTPANQLSRYQAASVNPNAIISGVTGNSPATMTSPDVSYHAPDYNAALATQIQKQALSLQFANQAADINLKNAQANNITKQSESQDITNSFLKQLLQNQVDVGFADINLKKSQKDLTDEQVYNVYHQTLNIQENMHNIRAQTALIKENIQNVSWKTKLDFQQYMFNDQAFVKLLKKYDLDANLTAAQISNVRAATQYLWSQVTGQNLQNSYQRQLNAFGAKTFNDKVSMFRTQRAMLSDQFNFQHINLESLGKLAPFDNYLNTFNLGATVIRNYLGIPGDFLDLATKPMSFGTNFVQGVSSMGAKFVP